MMPDAGRDGGTAHDASAADAAMDASVADADAEDASATDGSTTDGSVADGSMTDGSTADAALGDAGSDDAGSTDAGSTGPECDPVDPPDGVPVTAVAETWTWVSVPGATCRNGSEAGFGIRVNPATTKLLIYLGGGGLCFNGLSCASNASSFGSAQFDAWKQGQGATGIFDDTNPANPVRDWSFVYVPHCTGDGHAGSATSVSVPGAGAPQDQSFTGYTNLSRFLSRVVPTFPQVSQVVLASESVATLGLLVNARRVASDFCDVPVAFLADSFPPLSDATLAPCLQQRWRTLWNLDATLSDVCPAAVTPGGGNLVELFACIANAASPTRLGVVSSRQDSVAATFYGFGTNNCANLDGFTAAISGAAWEAGLGDLSTSHLTGEPGWSSYFVPGTVHTFLGNSRFYSTTVSDTSLTDWVAGFVDENPGVHVR